MAYNPTTSPDVFTSSIATFLVGETKVPVFVHSAVIVPLSDYFRSLFKSGLRESQTNIAELPSISVDDFGRFCQFAYSGNYIAPAYTLDPETEADNTKTKAAWSDEDPFTPSPTTLKSGKIVRSYPTQQERLENGFKMKSYCAASPRRIHKAM